MRRGLLLAALALLPWFDASSQGHNGSVTEPFTIAAASDLRFALDEILAEYAHHRDTEDIRVIYGSSGKMTTQIINGAPFDVFFSADRAYPEQLQAAGMTAADPVAYATGRIVLWSNTLDAGALQIGDLADDRIARIAIAQPAHAPYGDRARQALQNAGIWEQVQDRLVFGENIAQTAQMAEAGAADVGIIALSLALFPAMAEHGRHVIDEALYKPLTQSYVVTRHGADKTAVRDFVQFMETGTARQILTRYGFILPD